MKANMGNADRIIRILIAVVVGVLYWQGSIEGTLAYILIGLSIVFILTSLVNFCPLYALFGIKTCKTK
ncbi:Protein of unknown function [Formosa sp. Hel1_31_208]|uniref:YgaP family membrane protein n=1 Tax=Formosa sp. Hel1_31_208 TaxID=1798225 RepID=UPI00087C445A|nr:DUF2892 domain-containing protein [Formosa sp. Hel1_31_208]SDS24685.1 Protein of unknown function [Formosa sp. Hel1_31_208]